MPREIFCVIVLFVYCTVFVGPSSAVVMENVRKIHDIIETLESGNPNATIIILGDFNSAYVQLPHFYQQVTCSTRGNKTFDKCYINI